MSKRTVTIWWIAGAAIMAAGGFSPFLVARATNPGNLLHRHLWDSVVLLVLCFMVAGSGVIVQLVGWIGAVLNTHRLADKTWFNVLLWGGLVGIVTSPLFGLGAWIGWALMTPYLLAGPDAMGVQPPQTIPSARPTTLAATS